MTPIENDIAEKNIERLLGAAYKPETPDAAFAQTVTEYLCSVGKELAEKKPGQAQSDAHRYRALRRRLGWGMAAAACVAICALVIYARNKPGKRLEPDSLAASRSEKPVREREAASGFGGLIPRQRPVAPQAKPLAIGERLTTKAGERRRLTLSDGSILYLNQDTEVTQTAARRLDLAKGEVYLEVAQGNGSFVVKTPEKEVAALGTHFAVQAKESGTGVVVTQGKVEVNGKLIQTGQQIEPGENTVQPAPRASHLLDWTKPLMTAADAPLVPASKYCGGALLAIDPNGQEIHLTLRKYHIDVHIEDGFARTTIDQTYFNNEWSRLEGTFYFPLPADATLSRLAMYVEENGQCRLMEGGMAEREHARTVFETIMHTRRDPALLEWVDGTTFQMRVFPLDGRKEKRIILSYTQRLSDLYGSTRYRFPGGSNMAMVSKWSFQATIQGGAKLNLAAEPNITITKVGKNAVLTAQETDIKPDRDVSIEIRPGAETPQRRSARFSEFTHEKSRYLMVHYRPELAGKAQRQRRDWVILFESSANRDPLIARAQIDLVRYLLLNAEHDDTFVLLTANTRVGFFDRNARPATPKNIN
jgi:ferric-dicitrate binding protein FerR (iron transport regulator)